MTKQDVTRRDLRPTVGPYLCDKLQQTGAINMEARQRVLSCCSSRSVGSSTAELFSKQLTPVELKGGGGESKEGAVGRGERKFCQDQNTVTQNRAAPLPAI